MWTLRAPRSCVQVGRHGLGLGDLLRLQPLALEHVLEVHVAADVELVGAVEHTPRSSNSLASTRWVMVAPDLGT
jgi:hypothetical protein